MLLRDNQEKEVALKRMYRKQQVYIHVYLRRHGLYIYIYIYQIYIDTVCNLPAYVTMYVDRVLAIYMSTEVMRILLQGHF